MELKEDKTNLIIINNQRFKSDMVADKYIDTLDYSPKCLQR